MGRGGCRQAHRPAVPADDADVGLGLRAAGEAGFECGLVAGELVDLLGLSAQPVLDRLQHRELIFQLGLPGLGVSRGQGCRLGVFVAVRSRAGGGFVLFSAAPGQPAPCGAVCGGLGVAVVAGGLARTGLNQALPFDVESGYVVAARANHHQGGGHGLIPVVGGSRRGRPYILGLPGWVPVSYRRSVGRFLNPHRLACSVHVNRTVPKRQAP